jgi:hypothetical protein
MTDAAGYPAAFFCMQKLPRQRYAPHQVDMVIKPPHRLKPYT